MTLSDSQKLHRIYTIISDEQKSVAALRDALQLIERDPHQFGTGPCPTCITITGLIGRAFGCSAKV